MHPLEIALTYLMLKKKCNNFNWNNKKGQIIGRNQVTSGGKVIVEPLKNEGGKSLTGGSIHLMLEI